MRRDILRQAILAAMPVLASAALLVIPAMASAAFPGRNGKIAYTHQAAQSSASIYSVSPTGGSPTNLSAVGTAATMTADFQPAWSADGKQIAFVRVDFKSCSGQIWSMRQDGTGQTNLSKDAVGANEFNPAYGPDGSIVFVRAAPGTFNICTMTPVNQGNLWVRRPNGTIRQLTSAGAANTPAWSPDGSKIAFTHVAPGAAPHIFVVNANGTGTPRDLGPGVKPNWSPNGAKMTFAAPGMPNGPTGGPVTVMNANGTSRHTLNTSGTAPVWSPDGTAIAYITFDEATNSGPLGWMNANGQNQHNVTTPGSGNSDVKPDWQPILQGLRLSVTPRNAIGRQRTCFLFHVTSSGHGVADAQILFAHHRIFSSPRGRAQICAALDAGRHRATASKPGYRVATTTVRVRRRPRVPNPQFTG